MKRLFLLLFTPCLWLSVQAQTTVSVVESPNRNATSVNYTNYRAPLQQAPLLKLPVGNVQPKGWLRKYLELEFSLGSRNLYWDDLALFRYPEQFTLGIKEMHEGDIIEIDKLEELAAVDSSYLPLLEQKNRGIQK